MKTTDKKNLETRNRLNFLGRSLVALAAAAMISIGWFTLANGLVSNAQSLDLDALGSFKPEDTLSPLVAQPFVLGAAGSSSSLVVFPDGNSTGTQNIVPGLPGNAYPQGVSYYGNDNALVADNTHSRVFVILVSTNSLLSTIDTSTAPAYDGTGTIAVSPDGSVALACGTTNQLQVIHAPFNASSSRTQVTLSGAIAPFQTQAIVFNSAGRAFILDNSGLIEVLDAPYTSVAFTMITGSSFGALAISPDGNTLLTTNGGSIIRVFDAPFSSSSTPSSFISISGTHTLDGIMIAPDGSNAIVVDSANRYIAAITAPFASFSTVSQIALPAGGGSSGFEDVGISADSQLAVVTGNSLNATDLLTVIHAPFGASSAVDYVPITGVANAGRGAGSVRFRPPGVAGTPTPTATPTSTPTPTQSVQLFSAIFSATENNDARPETLEPEAPTGVANITVNRTGGTTGTVTVQFATANGTATGGASCTAGVDYVSNSGTLTFGPGVASQIFTINICDDLLVEGNETINLSISNPSGASLGTPSSAVLTIIDNDVATPTPTATPTGTPQPAILAAAGASRQIVDFLDPANVPSNQNLVAAIPANANPQGSAYYGTDNGLVLDSGNSRIFVTQVSTGGLLSTIDTSAVGYNTSGTIAVSPDGSTALAMGSPTAGVSLYVIHAPFNSSSAITSVMLPGTLPSFQTQAIVFNNAGRAFVFTIGGISVIDPPYTSVAFTIPIANSQGGSVAVSPDGNTLLLSILTGQIGIIQAPFSAASTPTMKTISGAVALDGIAIAPNGASAIVVDNGARFAFGIAAPFNINSVVSNIPLPAGSDAFEDVGISADSNLAILAGGSILEPPILIKAPFNASAVTSNLIINTVSNQSRGRGSVRFRPPAFSGPTPTPTNTPTATPTATPTSTPTATPTATPTSTPTATPTATPTNTPTATPTSTPTATPTPGGGFEGDVAPRNNGDGIVLTGDVVQMRRFATGLDTPNPSFNELQRADSAPRSTSGDGIINSGDVTQTRRYATGLDPLTPAGGQTGAAFGELAGLIGGSVFGEKVDGTSILRLAEIKSDKGTAFGVELESNSEAAAVSFTLRYDAAKLGRPIVSLADGTDGAVLTVNDTVEGQLTILVDSSGIIAANAKSVRIVDIAFEGSGAGSIWFDGIPSVSDAFGNEIGAVALSPVLRAR